jgi:hypothetical protein
VVQSSALAGGIPLEGRSVDSERVGDFYWLTIEVN